ncbi:DUF397 domain-containing protein [Streptomyces sp. NPDC005408]|uniref:DUF397 domain-containing protein n=1 Tax=Streptomyces sp. NPDC005408 TaxID=3155341 RepID=UPI0033AF2D55
MPQLAWQKSSFSGGGEGECVELAATSGDIHFRESDRPTQIATTNRVTLAALLDAIKAGDLSR